MEWSVAVLETGQSGPVLSFKDFRFRCDKSDATILNSESWNWGLEYGDKVSILTPNPFIRYQLISTIAELIEPNSGLIEKYGVVSWPLGVEGGLSPKLRVSHGLDFLREVYGDCLIQSKFPIDEFWQILLTQSIEPRSILKELTRKQRDFFYLALSILFLFDAYLISDARLIMSRPAKPLKQFLHLQLSGRNTLLTTTVVDRFRKEFCNKGLVVGAMGELLFAGSYMDAIEWYQVNVKGASKVEQDDNQFPIGAELQDAEVQQDDQPDDF